MLYSWSGHFLLMGAGELNVGERVTPRWTSIPSRRKSGRNTPSRSFVLFISVLATKEVHKMIQLITCSRWTELRSARYSSLLFLWIVLCLLPIAFGNFRYVTKIIFTTFPNRTEKTESNSKRKDFRTVVFFLFFFPQNFSCSEKRLHRNPFVRLVFVDSLLLLSRFRYCVWTLCFAYNWPKWY